MHRSDWDWHVGLSTDNVFHAMNAKKERELLDLRRERMERQEEIRRNRDLRNLCIVFVLFIGAIVVWLNFF